LLYNPDSDGRAVGVTMARSFNGSSDFITLGITQTTAFARPISFSCWALLNSGAGSFPLIIGFTAGGSFTFFGINIGSSSGLNVFYSGVDQTNNGSAFSTNVWHNCVFTDDGATVTVYQDGSSVGTGGSIGTITNSANVVIGNNAQGNSFWKGSIADAAFWNVVLTAAEIRALSNGARPFTIRPGNFNGYWPFDGLQSPEPDLSGKANNGTLTGTALAAGPPVMMFTPRWPQFLTPPAAAPFMVFQQAVSANISGSGTITVTLHNP
jgi:hypothetical protein